MRLLNILIQLYIFFVIISCIPSKTKINIATVTYTITDVAPQWLSRAGNEEILIDGDFSKISQPLITIDDRPCTSVVKISNSRFSCRTPANPEIENVTVKISIFNKVVAQTQLKYVGVLGQSSPSNVIQKQRGLNLPVMIKNLDSKLYIGDLGNRRILGFNNFTSLESKDFDFVIGLPNVSADIGLGPVSEGQYKPRYVDYNNGLFMFADGENNRVLIFDGYPVANQAPKIILGQPDATTVLVNNGGVSAKSLNRPMCAKFIDGKIFVADESNHRILVWNSIPTVNFKAADFVIGQPNFNTVTPNTGGLSAGSLSNPYIIEKIGDKLFVSDYGNGRVLIWDTVPSANTTANNVLGQANLITKSTTASSSITKGPIGFKYFNSTFYLADYDGYRVLVYKNFDPSLAIANGRVADIVLGQPNFSTTAHWLVGGKVTAQSLNRPAAVEIFNNKLYIADTYNNRILIYNHLPEDVVADQHQAADAVIGQESLSRNKANRTVTGPRYLPKPSNVAAYEGKLLVNSEDAGRISVWNAIPTDDFTPADFVLGQAGFGEDDLVPNRGLANPTASTLNVPYQMLTYNGKLYVSEAGNHRVLIWNSLTGTNGQPADEVFGQAGFNTRVVAPVSAFTMNTPVGMDIVDTKLIVNDRSNHRLLVYNTVPTTSTVAASAVIGQSNFTNVGPNGTSAPSTVAANTFSSPFNSATWLGQYVVADLSNRRVLVWSSVASFLASENPRSIWGQDNFISVDALSLSASRGSTYMTVRVINDILYVVDPYNNRILVFDTYPLSTIMSPSSVIGQKNLTSRTSYYYRPFGGDTLQLPVGMFEIEDKIYITDYVNDRVIIIPE